MDLNGPHPGAEELARRLIAHETDGRRAEELVPATERALQKLRQEMSRLLGTDGFLALEARALELARRRYPFLGSDGTAGSDASALDEVRSRIAERDPREVRDALQAVCAYLIELLFTFLGEKFTTHLIHLAWPDLSGVPPKGRERETR